MQTELPRIRYEEVAYKNMNFLLRCKVLMEVLDLVELDVFILELFNYDVVRKEAIGQKARKLPIGAD
jgi:hypothetical protein